MADETGNLEVQEAINKAIAARSALLSKQSEILRGQIQLAAEFAKAIKENGLNDAEKNLQAINAGLKNTSAAADNASSAVGGMTGSINDAASATADMNDEMKNTKKGTLSLGGIFKSVFGGVAIQLGGIFEILGSVARSFVSVATAIISIPFKFLDYLIAGADELMQRSAALREAYENLRDTFGDYAKNEGKAVVDSFNTLRTSAGGLAGTGLTMAKVFGHGPEGLAKALTELTETAAAMGPVFSVLEQSFAANADKIYVMSKGMGMSNEDLKALGSIAIATGQDMTQMLGEMGNLAVQMGEKFGISSKLIGKDLAYMTTNMGKFGSMTKTQMVTSAVYLRKLGMELKDIEGLMGAFDDFETAATNAAKLAQGFGMTVDAFKMMKEQDPAKRLDSLRQAFAATGRSIESMSRQEKALLAQSAGLDENMVSLALSSKNMGKSYEQIQREADKSSKKQLSQAEVMDKLSDNIKRLVETLDGGGGFMDRFFRGFEWGLKHSGPMMNIFRNLGQSLRIVEFAGRKVGDMFVNFFPGMKKMSEAISEFFSPERFSALTDGLLGDFKKFFEDLNKDPVKAATEFMQNIKKKFLNFFDPKTPEASKFMEGLGDFVKGMSAILGVAGKWLIEGATKAITGLTDYLKNPAGLSEGAQDGIMGMISPMIEAIGSALPALWEATKGLFNQLFEMLWPHVKKLLIYMIAFNFVKTLALEIVKAGGAAAVRGALALLAPKLVPPPMPPAGGAAAAKNVRSTGGMVQALNDPKLTPATIGKAFMIGMALVAFIAVAVVAFAGAVWAAANILKNVSWEDMAKVFVNTGVGLLAAIGLVKTADKGNAKYAQAGTNLLKAAAFVAVGVVGFAYAVSKASEVMQQVSWEDMAKVWVNTGLGVLAAWGLSKTASKIKPGNIVEGIKGMLGAALLLGVGMVAFAGALRFALWVMGDEALGKAGQFLMIMGGAMLATLAFAAIAAGAALLMAGPQGLALVAGLAAAAAFFTGGVVVFAGALALLIKETADMGLDFDKADRVFGIVMKTAAALKEMASVAMMFSVFNRSRGKLEDGIEAAGQFLATTAYSIRSIIQTVMNIPMADPSTTYKKVDVLSKVIASVSSFASLATKAGELGAASEALGGTTIVAAVNSMSSFLTSASAAIVNVVKTLATMAVSWSEQDLTKMQALAGIIEAIAGLSANLLAPMTTIAGADTSWYSESTYMKVSAMTQGITKMMQTMVADLPALVKAVVGVADTTLTEDQAKGVIRTINAAQTIAGALSSMTKDFMSMDTGWFSDTSQENLTKSIAGMEQGLGRIGQGLGSGGSLRVAVNNMTSSQLADKEKTAALLRSMSSMGHVVEKLSSISSLKPPDYLALANVADGVDYGMWRMYSMANGIADTAGILSEHVGAQYSSIVQAVVDDIRAVNDALADLGDININSTIDRIGDGLQLKKEVLNIERKPIQMTVNLNLAMKAEDIAKEIFKVAAKLSEKESEPDNKAIRQAFGLPV